MPVIEGLDEFESLTGVELGVGKWLTVTQEIADWFADLTRDRQWIHVNPD